METPILEELIEQVGDRQLALDIYRELHDSSVEWLDRRVPALGGKTPRSCLRSKEGRHRIRSVLARMH